MQLNFFDELFAADGRKAILFFYQEADTPMSSEHSYEILNEFLLTHTVCTYRRWNLALRVSTCTKQASNEEGSSNWWLGRPTNWNLSLFPKIKYKQASDNF